MTSLSLHLVDIDAAVADALRDAFSAHPEVSVQHGDLLQLAHGAALSPANSMGFMDGGIDRLYSSFFGAAFAGRVRDAVLSQPEGHLPIGAAIAVPTGHERVQHVVLAPTMISPEHVPAENAYRALRAALRLMMRSPELGSMLYSPDLTTLVGGVAPADAAREMALAYTDWKTG